MVADKVPFLLFGSALMVLFFITLYSWWMDYQFYKKNNWDYSLDSGREMRFGTAYVKLSVMSNEVRMKKGYPRFLTIALIMAAIAFSPFYFSA